MTDYYAVIFDAGSTGTRPFIYRITPKVVNNFGSITQVGRVVEVITHPRKSLAKTPVAAGGIQNHRDYGALKLYLDPLFNEVFAILERPQLPRLRVEYYLYATGGVRDNLTQGEKTTLRESVERYFRETTFRGASIGADSKYDVIAGTVEAKFGWVAANRSQGRLYDAGYVEMGGATAQIVIPLRPQDIAVAQGVADEIARANQPRVMARVEVAGPRRGMGLEQQWVFLASYPLGSDAGYTAYKNALFENGEDYGLRGEEEEGRRIFYDPSKRLGWPRKVEGTRIITSRPAPPGENRVGDESNLAKTLRLVDDALKALFPGAPITLPLDERVRDLDFIGVSNFWHTMCGALNVERALNFSTFQRMTRDSHKLTQAQFRAPHRGKPRWLLEIYDNSTFINRWTLHVLHHAFGFELLKPSGAAGKEMTFTPYNGQGADDGRFSWTLGVAVLLASEDLNGLDNTPDEAFVAPAPAAGD